MVNLPGVDTFLGLSDTPESYVGAGTVPGSTVGRFVAVKADETGLEFILGPLGNVTGSMDLGLVNIKALTNPGASLDLGMTDLVALANPTFSLS